MKHLYLTLIILSVWFLNSPALGQAIIAEYDAASALGSIPTSTVNQIGSEFKIFYGHTSHGSQILTGMDIIESVDGTYDQPEIHELLEDLGNTGDIHWVQPTRDFLDANPEFNVVMWSWCGGVSDNTEEGIDIYLHEMSQLEQDYPHVTFIYMTGHLDGTGIDGNLFERNNQIRTYCLNNDKVLFDFADIESYDPDGVFYPDGTDACEWCYDWCAVNDCLGCVDCAHSHCLNCYRKGKAFWWLMARLTGWTRTTDVGGSPEPNLPAGFELAQNQPNPFNPATTIEYTLAARTHVAMEIYNLLGEKVRTLFRGLRSAGTHRCTWNGTDDNGSPVASGVYLYRMSSDSYRASRKMLLIR